MSQYKTIHESSKLELNLGCHDQKRKVKFGQKQKKQKSVEMLRPVFPKLFIVRFPEFLKPPACPSAFLFSTLA